MLTNHYKVGFDNYINLQQCRLKSYIKKRVILYNNSLLGLSDPVSGLIKEPLSLLCLIKELLDKI